jgi:hypothetical protein
MLRKIMVVRCNKMKKYLQVILESRSKSGNSQLVPYLAGSQLRG